MDLADELLQRIVREVAHSPVLLEERELRLTVELERKMLGGQAGRKKARGRSTIDARTTIRDYNPSRDVYDETVTTMASSGPWDWMA